MLLEEILPYVRMGHKPKLDGREYDTIAQASTWGNITVNEILLSDKWGYAPKYVGWDEALRALVDHKEIIADDIVLSDEHPKRKHFSMPDDKSCLLYRHGHKYTWAICTHGVPLHWIGKTNFEILED